MKFLTEKFSGLLAVLSALFLSICFLSACSDSGSSAPEKFTDDGDFYSPQDLLLYGSYEDGFYVKGFRVVRLDSNFNPVDTLMTQHANYPDTGFVTGEKTFPSPYVMIIQDVVGSTEKNKMEFIFFRDISVRYRNTLNRIRLNDWKEALLSGRIETLLRKGKSVDEAIEHAREDFEESLGENWDSSWTDVLCRFQNSDSSFYKNFKELNALLADGKADLSDWIIRVADALFEDYQQYITISYESTAPLNYEKKNKMGLDFISAVYGLEKCTYDKEYDSTVVNLPRSKFNGELLVCEMYDVAEEMSAIAHVWRPISEMEKKLKHMCWYYRDWNVVHGDELYNCEEGSSKWKKEEDSVAARKYIQNYHVQELYGRCGGYSASIGEGVLRYYNDTLFVCMQPYANGEGSWTYDPEYVATHYKEGAYIDSATAFGDACIAQKLGNCTPEIKGQKEIGCDGFFECDAWSDGSGARWWSRRAIDFFYGDECNQDSAGKKITLTEDLSNSVWVCSDTTEYSRTVYKWMAAEAVEE